MKIEFENSIRRLNFLCRLTNIKIAWINARSSMCAEFPGKLIFHTPRYAFIIIIIYL